MGKSKRDSRGFTLIAALLLTVLLSGIAVGLLYMVSNEERMGGNDLEGSMAFYGAESGIENLTAELSQLYQTSQTPTAAAITALTVPANYPTMVTGSNITSMNYQECITWPPNTTCPAPSTNPTGNWDIVGSGSDQGMVATLIPYTLTVTATRASTAGEATNNTALTNITGASVNLSRTVEVALLPAFEFGVFCDGDCDYFAGPNFNFGGRVHTNGNLFLASGDNLTFTDKLAAVGQVITTQLENGWPTATDYGGTVYVPNAAGGCPGAPGTGPAADCIALSAGSWAGGFPAPSAPATCTADCGGAANAGWKGISTTTFNSFIINGLTGATKLQLPFVSSSKVGAIDIIRRPQASDTPLLTGSRLYNEASIRVLLADTQADLHPERGALGDGQDVQLGVTTVGSTTSSVALTGYTGATNNMYYGVATAGTNGWVAPTNPATGTAYGWTSWPLLSQITSSPASAAAAPTTAYVWLRVEYCPSSSATSCGTSGGWVGITTQWLGYGFGRGYNTPPTAPYIVGGASPACTLYPTFPAGQCYNPISPAILILQQLNQGVATASAVGSGTAGNWIPINFYDSREGEPRDVNTRPTNTTTTKGQTVYTPCSPIGVMNVVELDVGNLWLWLQGAAPYTAGSGTLVNNANFNGYILYFSDRRGMLPDPNPTGATVYNSITGFSGLEDTINGSSATGVPDGKLEPATYYSYSPEDVNGDGYFDNYGEKNLAAGFGLIGAYTSTPYFPIPANAQTVSANQVNCNSYTLTAGGAIETYPTATGTAGATVYAGNPQNNVVYGPRHGLRLVDGGMSAKGVSYLPQPISPATSGNGFTVGSEAPVYVWGDYNTGAADPLWPAGGTTTAPHSAASIIADSVTLLSNPPSTATAPTTNVGWTDVESFLQPGVAGNRPGNNSYYRMAIAAGKSIPFFEPAWASAAGLKDFGTDGGMHNFLRYLEDRSDGLNGGGGTVNYAGSLISMYYSQYLTGVFKCCNTVYGAPTRNYFFDTQFLNPTQLPPGTPMFQDVVSLSYHQNFTPQ
jgi:hypothetical protein